jgi:hypothetical protein
MSGCGDRIYFVGDGQEESYCGDIDSRLESVLLERSFAVGGTVRGTVGRNGHFEEVLVQVKLAEG